MVDTHLNDWSTSMLPPENEPFAKANQDNLASVYDMLSRLKGGQEVTIDDIDQALNYINLAHRGFERYKVCFADEVRQKQRAQEKANFCRFNHK
jgi:hypothetical protein